MPRLRPSRLLLLTPAPATLVAVAIFALARQGGPPALTPTYEPFVLELAITIRGGSTRATFAYEDCDRWRYDLFRDDGPFAHRQEVDGAYLFATPMPFGFTQVMSAAEPFGLREVMSTGEPFRFTEVTIFEGAQAVPHLWFRARDSLAPTVERSPDRLTFTQTREVPCGSPLGTCTEVTRHQFDEASELPILYQIEIDGVVGYEVRVVNISFEDVNLPDLEPPATRPASTPEKTAIAR